jgi:hypothetical protein
VTSTAVAATGPLCAQWTREHQVDPVGTIGSYRAFLLVEWPLPWPREVGEIPELLPLAHKLSGVHGRLQALVPDEREGSTSRAVLYRADPGPFVAYQRTEVAGPPDEIVSLASGLLDSLAPAAPADSGGRELLVCTHGARDRCCGSLGTRLERAVTDEVGPDGTTRVRRTSHTGGHRFAPTAILLPEGTGWGYLDEDVLRTIVHRSGAVVDVLPLYRGCAGLTTPRIQAVERAVLAEVGWGLFDCARQGSEQGDGNVRLSVSHADGEQVWTAQVRTGRTLPVPGCGTPIQPDGKTAEEFIVDALRRVR